MMASEKSLEMRFDKASLTSSPIYPNRLVAGPNGSKFYVCKAQDGDYYGSKELGGQVVNISRFILDNAPEEERDAILNSFASEAGGEWQLNAPTA